MSLADAVARILAALENIPYQSSKHLCASTGLPVETVLDVVDACPEIAETQAGQIAVYHLVRNRPDGRLVLNTEAGRFDHVPKAAAAPVRETAAQKLDRNRGLVVQMMHDGKGDKEICAALGMTTGAFWFTLKSGFDDIQAARAVRRERRRSAKSTKSALVAPESPDEAEKLNSAEYGAATEPAPARSQPAPQPAVVERRDWTSIEFRGGRIELRIEADLLRMADAARDTLNRAITLLQRLETL